MYVGHGAGAAFGPAAWGTPRRDECLKIAAATATIARVGRNVTTILRFFTGFALAASWTAAAMAADATTVPDSLRACAAIRNDGDRHACYDREMARLLPESAAAAA